MAVPHFSVSIVARGSGRSAVLSAAYRHCARMDYEREARTIDYTRKQVEKLLTVRSGSELFRLRTAEQVSERLAFHNTGPSQVPGVIAFSLDDGPDNGLTDLDSDVDQIVVVINSTGTQQALDTSLNEAFSVMTDTSPEQTAAATNGTFTVPALSVAVFNR